RERVRADRPGGWLVDLDDVRAERAQLAPQICQVLGEDPDVRNRPVRPERLGAPERCELIGLLATLGAPTVKRPGNSTGWIPGGKHTEFVPTVDQLIREFLHV